MSPCQKQLGRTELILVLFSAICCVAGGALAQSPVVLTIAGSRGYADFSGLSFETGSQQADRHGISGNLFSATNTQLITLVRNLGIRNLRVGGGSLEGKHAAILNHTDIDNLFAFAQAAGVKVIYSLPLLNANSATNAVIAQHIWQHYYSLLDCFSIGNEPDWKSYHYPPFGNGSDPAITNYTTYLDDWRTFAAAITNAIPGALFAGPDTGSYTASTHYNGQSWTQHFAEDEKGSGILKLVTQHFYVGASPLIQGTRSPIPIQQAIDNMLSPSWNTITNQWLYGHNLVCVMAEGLPYRLTESNDYLYGVTNASNAFASALWALDYMHWWASHNCAGVNFHNKQWLKTDTVYLDASGNYQINPKGYGIKAFDLGSHGCVEPVKMINANGLNLTAYAVGTATNLYVTIINKEHGPAARDANVIIKPNDFNSASVSVMFLSAPENNVGATNGMTLGGAIIINNAAWLEKWTALSPVKNGQCELTVPAATAAIVKLSAR
jgi:hypothetical protein